MNKFQRICLLLAIVYSILLLSACTTTWTSEAQSIISIIEAAIPSLLAILAAFGVTLAPSVVSAVQSWATQAQLALTQVATLITQYETAAASAQPGILTQIETILTTVSNNLESILPTLHVTDPATQAKIVAVFTIVEDELVSLLELIPVIKGEVTDHDAMKALIAKVKSAKEFKHDYNIAAGKFGRQYEIN